MKKSSEFFDGHEIPGIRWGFFPPVGMNEKTHTIRDKKKKHNFCTVVEKTVAKPLNTKDVNRIFKLIPSETAVVNKKRDLCV